MGWAWGSVVLVLCSEFYFGFSFLLGKFTWRWERPGNKANMGPWQQGVHPQLMKALSDLHSVCFHCVHALYVVLHVITLEEEGVEL